MRRTVGMWIGSWSFVLGRVLREGRYGSEYRERMCYEEPHNDEVHHGFIDCNTEHLPIINRSSVIRFKVRRL